MYELNLRKCSQLLKDKPVYRVATKLKKINDDCSKFFSIVCKCKSLNQIKDVSINELIRYITNAEDYIENTNDAKKEKRYLMQNLFAAQRIEKKRLF